MNDSIRIKMLSLMIFSFLLIQCESNISTTNKSDRVKDPVIANILPGEQVGYVEGNACYPADGIPGDMKIYAENLKYNRVYMVPISNIDDPNVFVESAKFKLQVPAGDYHVYAKTNYASKKHYKAYYSEFVTCGLHAKCQSHVPILVKVSAGKTITNIDPCDWYDRSNASGHK